MISRLSATQLRARRPLTGLSLVVTLSAVFASPSFAEEVPVSTLGDNLRGELTSASPVNLNDGTRYSSHRFCAGNGDAIALYQFQGPFSARLSLIDENYSLIGAGNKATAAEGGLVLIDPPADQCVTLIVSGQNSNAYGPYQLNAVSASDSTRRLQAGESILAEMGGNKPMNLPLNVDDATELDLQLIDTSGRLGLSISGDNFRDQALACGDKELRMTTYLEPGDYQISLIPGQRPTNNLPDDECAAVATTDGQAFYLKSTASLMPEGMRNGGPLSNGDEIIGVLGNGRDNEYRFTLDELAQVTINLASSDFDTVLEIQGPYGDQRNDDSGNGTNSEIDSVMRPGDYRVLVQSFGSGNGGQYDLRARIEPFSGELTNEGSIEPGEQLTGLHSGTDNTYSLTIEERSEVTIDVGSENFDTLVTLVGNSINLSDDDGGDGTNSRIETLLEPGTYSIQVSAYGSAGGVFNISVAQAEAVGRLQDGGEVAPGDVVYGQMRNGQPLTYNLTVDSARTVSISASSTSADTVLTLSGGGLNLEDDDGGEGTNSLIEQFLTPGEYTIQVRDFGNSSNGTIRLEITQATAVTS
ncbi:PPC domain-containing protein [Saccharospirillum sp. HFRX-1]|uniref:PPC domain-containing protein n=1 Tax=unclassified Saccharospirillum TaxID=2633430 RepID=UPI0037200CCE